MLTALPGFFIGRKRFYGPYHLQGESRQRYKFDMLQHGPMLSISARF
jgi:hypothetical protein